MLLFYAELCFIKNDTMFKKTILVIATGLLNGSGLTAQNQFTMKSINPYAPVKCSKSIMIYASPEKIWNVITRIDCWADWQTDIKQAKLNGSLQPSSTFDWKTGGAKIHSTLHTVNMNSEFGWTGKTFGMHAIHNWTIQDHNGSVEVRVDESMEGFLASLFKNSFNRNLEKGMENWLQLLKKECERN